MNIPCPTLAKKIAIVNYGEHQMVPPYSSPIPVIDQILNICPYCITQHPTLLSLQLHTEKCTSVLYPPLYEEKENGIKIAMVTDLKTKQLLCLFGRLFIRSKTLFYEVWNYDVFIVYNKEVMGYFSRPQNGNYSLSCIAVWPCFGREGLGSLLIDFSYLKLRWKNDSLTNKGGKDASCDISENEKSEGELGERMALRRKGHKKDPENSDDAGPSGPERPFSKAAIFCFRKYWKYRVMGARTIRQISEKANISIDDAIVGLELNGFNFKKWELDGTIVIDKPRLLTENNLKTK